MISGVRFLEVTVPISAARNVSNRLVTPSSSPTLRAGDFGASVTELQNLLKRAGFPTGPVDGDFGPMTTAAVKRFQAARGLGTDGVVGPNTWAALKASAPTPAPTTGATQPTLRSGDLEFGAMTLNIPRGSPIDIFMGTPQPDLERTGVPMRMIFEFEHGLRPLQLDQVAPIAQLFGVAPQQLAA